MKHIVFEAGSRAGYSAEMFFKDYVKRTQNDDVLIMVDDDMSVNKVRFGDNILRTTSDVLNDFNDGGKNISIFPADELTRQHNSKARKLASKHKYSRVEDWYYDKKSMNEYLAEKAKGSSILIPKTFDVKNVCIRPNTLSAGSKGLQLLDNVSITQKLNIVEEYVVDVLRDDDNIRVFPRQVKLKNGYDRLIMPISESSLLADDIVEFITKVSPSNEGIFSDIFHLQLAKADDGNVYYIEWSKRISGTSVVNLFRGMSPFCFINGIDVKVENPFSYGEWYRYEDFLNKISCL